MHCNEVPWRWSKPEQEAFENIKAALCLDSIPCNPDPTVELALGSCFIECRSYPTATRTWWYVTTGCLWIHDTEQWGNKLLSNLTRVISLWFWRHLILSVPTRQTFQASYGSKTVDNLTRGTQACAQNGGSKNQKMGVTLSCLWLDHRSFCPENPLTLRGLLRNKWL